MIYLIGSMFFYKISDKSIANECIICYNNLRNDPILNKTGE